MEEEFNSMLIDFERTDFHSSHKCQMISFMMQKDN